MAVNCPQPASWMDLARLDLPSPATFKVSKHTVWFSRISLVESWWWKSRRASAAFTCRRPTLRRAFSRFFDPLCFLLMFRWERRNAFCRCRSQRGLSSFRPSERTTKVDRPRSTPTAVLITGSGVSRTSTTNEAWYLPAPSRVTVIEDGSAGRGRDHRTLRAPILGSDRRPSGRSRKRLLLVNRMAWPERRDLKRGLRCSSVTFRP